MSSAERERREERVRCVSGCVIKMRAFTWFLSLKMVVEWGMYTNVPIASSDKNACKVKEIN